MISIVTSYYNRKKLFYHTLLRLKASSFKDIEVIAVDDGSNDENRLEDLQKEFGFLKVIRVEPADKWYINACVPFNMGFRAAAGEIIIIQNPECLHYGDILQHVADNLKPNDYISFAAYSLDKTTTDKINGSNAENIESLNIPFIPEAIHQDGDAGWYNHSVYKPRGFHWCAAIYREALLELGGFDEQFALGIAFDDIELLERIKRKGMDFKIIDDPFVLHQNHFEISPEHKKSIHPEYSRRNADLLWYKNEYRFYNRTMKSSEWKAKPRSIKQIRGFDRILTYKFNTIKNCKSLSWRVKNKLKRIFK